MEEAKKKLLEALAEEGISLVVDAGKNLELAHRVTIEIEGVSLFKLLDDGYVVAPFSDPTELAGFIRMDWMHRSLEIK